MNGREAALHVLDRVELGGYADALLASVLKAVPARDRALATELTYGVLRYRARLDWIIGVFSSVKTKKLEHSVLNALRLGVYQIYILDNIPVSAAINGSVELIKPRGLKKAGFVNAVLRKAETNRADAVFPAFDTDPLRHISIVYSHPQWLVAEWIERFGADGARELCRANLAPPPKTLRVNTLAATRPDVMAALAQGGAVCEAARYSPDGVHITSGVIALDDRGFYQQDEGSQLIAYLLAPKPGETILDACAAPGGKTTHIAALMKNEGAICALDKDARRLNLVGETASRLGVTIITSIEADASRPLPSKAVGEYDGILCDAPCSGLGVVGRTPEIKWRRGSGDIKDLAARQSALLDNLAQYVRPGGRIVYSVCSLEPMETDTVVDGFLSTHKGFVQEDAAKVLPHCDALVNGRGRLLTLPHRDGMDGFFAACLRRVG